MIRRRPRVNGRGASLLLLFAGAFLAAQPAAAAPVDGPTGTQGFLYELTRAPDQRLVVFGTLHVGALSAEHLNALSASELKAAQRLAIEADPRDSATLARMLAVRARYSPGDSLADHVPAALLDQVMATAQQVRIPLERPVTMRPWVLSNILLVGSLQRIGLSSRGGSEISLVAYAEEHGVPIVEIEGIERQLALLSDVDEATQIDELSRTVADIQSGAAIAEVEALLRAWRLSDEAAIGGMLDEMARADGPFAHFLYRDVITARNRSMADRAEALATGGGTTFFAVGSLHLFGDTGLLAELVRRGWTLRNLQPPANS